ncbi:polysaccharide biosynthesis/export family protein [Candidatus Halobeggiatoa sp. HSG11]|nr:polysaccharide biosynthesis/export family protein [Candidatus Halobeggiatoa sp. HSG11]
MHSTKILLLLFILIGFGCTQNVSIPDKFVRTSPPSEKVVKTPNDILQTFRTSVVENDKEYHLGTGDDITIEVWGYHELSGKHIVGPDGKITLPLVGPIKLTDLSREQAAENIANKLSKYYLNLSVAVRINQYASNRVLVLGRVSRPGEVRFNMTTPTLLEAISLAGGFSNASGLQGEAQSLSATRCAIFRGQDKIVWIDIEPLLTGTNLSLNLPLKRNDIVYIPDIKEKLVYVLGQVHNPGAFRLLPQMSLFELVARAGGLTRDADFGSINVIRPSLGTNEPMTLSELMAPEEELDNILQEGDVIYVPTNTIAKINYAIQFLNPFTTMLGIYADIASIQADSQRHRLDKEKESLELERTNIENEKAVNSILE